MTIDSLRPRQRLGLACSLASVLCAAFAAMLVLDLVFSPGFAADFDGGTHTADYSGMLIAQGLAIAAVVFAAVGVAVGNMAARVTGGLVLLMPGLVVLDAILSR